MTTIKELFEQKKRLDKAYKEARTASIKVINDHLKKHPTETFTTRELAKIGEIPLSILCGCSRQIKGICRSYKVKRYYIEVDPRGCIINSEVRHMTVNQPMWSYE